MKPPLSDPRLRWPTAFVIGIACVCTTATLIFAEGDVKTALLAILVPIGTVVAGLLPSLLPPRSAP